MFFESPLNIGGYSSVEVTLLILNNINKPIRLFHVNILTRMSEITIPFSEFKLLHSRSGGAGGQNVNKVNSKVLLEWRIDESASLPEDVKERFKKRFPGFLTQEGVVQITGQRFRSQKDNQDDCIRKLHDMIAEVRFPPKLRKATKPKRSAVMKRLNTKRKDSEKKQLRRKDY